MTTDLTFITNENGKTLLDRFTALIGDTRLFDCLVGYFYTSGFHSIYKSLKKTEKIRILIGISTNKETFDLIQESKKEVQQTLQFSHKETKDEFSDQIVNEMETSKDSFEVEEALEEQQPFINIADQILAITKDDDYLDSSEKQARVKELEKEIDKLVYKLYDLTPEEIDIVENFNKDK